MWATILTFFGSMAAMVLAQSLVKSFSGRGFVADSIVNDPIFAVSVALGSAFTVIAATNRNAGIQYAYQGGSFGRNPADHFMRCGKIWGIGDWICSAFDFYSLMCGALSFLWIKFQQRIKPDYRNCLCITDTQIHLQTVETNQFTNLPPLIFDESENCKQLPLDSGMVWDKEMIEVYLH